MNDSNLILPHSIIPVSTFLVSGSLPTWEQLPREHQHELVQALATLLMQLPQLQILLEAPHESEQ
jgi:hypothetical protein